MAGITGREEGTTEVGTTEWARSVVEVAEMVLLTAVALCLSRSVEGLAERRGLLRARWKRRDEKREGMTRLMGTII